MHIALAPLDLLARLAALVPPPREQSHQVKDFRQFAKDSYTDQITAILAKQYAVSEDAMRFRLMNLNFLQK